MGQATAPFLNMNKYRIVKPVLLPDGPLKVGAIVELPPGLGPWLAAKGDVVLVEDKVQRFKPVIKI